MVISRTPVETGIDFFNKTLTHTPVVKTTSNNTGDEILTSGTSRTIKGAFYRREDSDTPDKPGLFNEADAILLVKIKYSDIGRNDIITYNNEEFRVQYDPVLRTLGETKIYYKISCFKI